jgi:hypothetical protein
LVAGTAAGILTFTVATGTVGVLMVPDKTGSSDAQPVRSASKSIDRRWSRKRSQ